MQAVSPDTWTRDQMAMKPGLSQAGCEIVSRARLRLLYGGRRRYGFSVGCGAARLSPALAPARAPPSSAKPQVKRNAQVPLPHHTSTLTAASSH
eukprot:7389694-Prymnesium_polylepis.1